MNVPVANTMVTSTLMMIMPGPDRKSRRPRYSPIRTPELHLPPVLPGDFRHICGAFRLPRYDNAYARNVGLMQARRDCIPTRSDIDRDHEGACHPFGGRPDLGRAFYQAGDQTIRGHRGHCPDAAGP